MKKKILEVGIAVLLVVILFILTGCGNENKTEKESQNNNGKTTDRTELKIGDYVDYTYDTADNYTVSADESGYIKEQSVKQENLKWRIFNIDKETGRVDLISTETVEVNLQLSGATGYNNAVYLLNDIIKKQYSNSNLGIIARSINIEDIEQYFNDKGNETKLSNKDGSTKFGETAIYETDVSYYPTLYAKENGSGVTSTIKNDGIGISENNTLIKDDGYLKADSGLTATLTSYNFLNPSVCFDNSTVYDILFDVEEYWIASRCVSTAKSCASFGLFYIGKVTTDDALDFYGLFESSNGKVSGVTGGLRHLGIRPIVSIDGNTKITANKGTITQMHTID